MNYKLAYTAAIVGILLNIILSFVVPKVIQGTEHDHAHDRSQCNFLCEISDMFSHHQRTLLSSSAIVATAVFLSVIISEKHI